MNILFTSSNEYACHVGVAITSLFENNISMRGAIDVYIMTTGYDDDNIAKFNQLSKKYNRPINIITVSPEEIKLQMPEGKWGIYTYLKLFAYKYIKVDRLLYLDSDIIICPNKECHLTDIESIDLSDYYIALPPDTNSYNYFKKNLPFYGCCGVIYMNLKKWRDENLTSKALKFLDENKEHIKFAEQDILNNICQGYIYELPLRYGIMSIYLKNRSFLPEGYENALQSEISKTIVLHYAAVIKPWNTDCDFYLKYLYWKYQKISGWYVKAEPSPDYTVKRQIGKFVFNLLQNLGIYRHKGLYFTRKELKKLNPNW